MNKWRALWTTVGLAALVALTSIASGCVVKGKAGVTASGTVTVVDQQPPPPRYERPPAREGRVWLRGHWQWRNGQWVWRRGSWVRPRRGHHWEPGHWVLRSGRYHFVRGRWVRGRARAATPPRRDYRKAAVDGPSKAPPAPRYKRVRPRPGYVWVRGHYQWEPGRGYYWVGGRWLQKRSGKQWVQGRWQLRGRVYVWLGGRWQ